MKKRLTAWLLVFCMTLSLLPGTAFAAENTGSGDGTVTITYDLNDGISDYQLQLKTTPGKAPVNEPSAKWAGRPFITWTSDKGGQVMADYSKDTTLYAKWGNGYTVKVHYGPGSITSLPADKDFTTEHTGRLPTEALEEINQNISDFERSSSYAFDGWYTEYDEDTDTYSKPFGDISGKFEKDGVVLFAKWVPIYTITFKYNNPADNPEIDPQIIKTKKGGILQEMPPKPTYEDDPYTFDGWYILADQVNPAATSLRDAVEITSGNLKGKKGIKLTQAALENYSFIEAAKDLGGVHAITVEANWSVPFGIIFEATIGHFGTDINKVKETIKTDKLGNLSAENWPDDPVCEGYKFLGWYKGSSGSELKDDDVKLQRGEKFSDTEHVYAKWRKLTKVTVNYDATGYNSVIRYVDPEAESDDDRKIADLLQLLQAAETTVKKEGFVFRELWHVEGTAVSGTGTAVTDEDLTAEAVKQLTFKGDTEIKALWANGFYITFDYNHADSVDGYTSQADWPDGESTDTRGYLELSDLPTPSRNGYNFKGWYKGSTKVPVVTVGTEKFYDVGKATQTITAQWGAPYDVTLNPNGGTITKSDGTTTKDELSIKSSDQGTYLAFPSVKNAGQKFMGWYEMDANGNPMKTKEAKEGGTCSGPVTLIADWGEFTITLNANGGSLNGIGPKLTTTKGVLPTLPLTLDPYTQGSKVFRFSKWTTVDGVEVTRTYQFEDTGDNKEIVIYAQWVEDPAPKAPISANKAPNKVPAASKPAASASAPGGPMLIADAGDTGVYKITFDPDNGTAAEKFETKETAGGRLTALPTDPVKTGYTFLGWFVDVADENTKITIGTAGTEFKQAATVKAKWGAPYTITFYNNDGSTSAPVERKTEADGTLDINSLPPTPVRTGYNFLGWYTDATNGTEVEHIETKVFDGPAKLYAHWQLKGHTITFVYNDGTDNKIAYDTDSGGKVKFPEATRDGYSLDGWYTEAGAKIPDGYAFKAPTTLYARWIKEITVTFHPCNGTDKTTSVTTTKGKWLEKDSTTEITNVDLLLAEPTYGGHHFEGWFDQQSGGTRYTQTSQIIGDIDLYARWKVQEYTIKWVIGADDANLKSIPDTTTVGGKLPSIPQLTRPGKLFDGWTFTGDDGKLVRVTADTIFSKDTTLTAKWEPPTPFAPTGKGKEITFIVDVPTPLPDAAHFVMHTDDDGYLQHLPTLLSRDDADGWRRQNGSTAVTTGEKYMANTDLYINVAQTITVTFDWNNAKDGGTSYKTTVRTDKDGKIPEDKWPDALAPDKNPGYQFAGWYDKADDTGKPVSKLATFKEATTIYAHWKGPFTITFDANGGKFPDGTTTKGVETDDDGNLDPLKVAAEVPTPTREGYTKFGGWSRTKDGTEAVEPDAEPYTGAATLYAIWGPPYAIKFDPMGGEVTPTETMSTEDGKYPELPVPTHPRDTFAGWYTTKDYQEGTLVAAGGACTGAVTLYAKWTREPPFTITFVANQEGATMEDPTTGSAVATLTLKTDDKGVLMQAPPEPTLRGGKFQGWYTKQEEGTGELYADAATRTYTDDMTLYAHWDTMEFKITFDFNLQAINKDLNITTYTTTKSKSLTFLPGALPQAASGDYQIKGWYRVPNPVDGKDSPVTTSDTFDRDTTLYAQWERATNLPIVFRYPNITFMNEDGSAAMVTLEVDKDYKLAVIPEPPYKAGYNFKPDGEGWVTHTPDGKVDQTLKEILAAGPITGNLVVYPQYTSNGFTITFEPGEESELDPIKVTTTAEGRIPDGSMPSPTWEGHTLTGWYTSASGGTRITRRTVFTQDTTVYAHWDEGSGPDNPDDPNNPDNPTGPTSPPFTITFNPNGGNLNANTTALTDLNGRLMALPTPARTGYSFDGWFNGNERVTTATVFTANTTINAQWSTGSGGSGSGSGDINVYAITVSNTTGGRVSVSTTYAREGDRVTVTVRPYSGYQLDRIDVTNARGYDVALREEGGNRYVFYMPASRVTVDAVFMDLIANSNNGNNSGNTGNNGNSGSTGGNTGWNPGGSGTGTNPSGGATSGMGIFSQPVLNTVPMPYLDVYPSDWYYSSVDYMWQRQLMGGVSSNRFGPQATTSNAMVWTILARLAGVDVTAGASAWYENARSWAVSNRISDGVGPNSAVTREQLATMLWNFKGSPAVGYDLGQFGDRGQISTYQAECALRWAVANNIVTGTANRLNPRGTATRAEVAAMITRFCQNT